jgi:hypothetical protein
LKKIQESKKHQFSFFEENSRIKELPVKLVVSKTLKIQRFFHERSSKELMVL